MEEKELENFTSSCNCKVCSECQLKNISDFMWDRLDYFDYSVMQAKRPHTYEVFEKYQIFDMNIKGDIDWRMRNSIRFCFNKYRDSKDQNNCFSKYINDTIIYKFWFMHRSNDFVFEWSTGNEQKQTKTIVFKQLSTQLFYVFCLTKCYNFTLKTLAGLKVNAFLNYENELKSLVTNQILPQQLADFLLSLHKM